MQQFSNFLNLIKLKHKSRFDVIVFEWLKQNKIKKHRHSLRQQHSNGLNLIKLKDPKPNKIKHSH